MTNPYAVGGFQQGLMQGINLWYAGSAQKLEKEKAAAWREDRVTAGKDRERRISLEDEDRTIAAQERVEAGTDRDLRRNLFDIQIKGAQLGLDSAPTADQAKEINRTAVEAGKLGLDVQRANIAQSGQAIRASQAAVNASNVSAQFNMAKLDEFTKTAKQKDAIQKMGGAFAAWDGKTTDAQAAAFIHGFKALGVPVDHAVQPEVEAAGVVVMNAFRSKDFNQADVVRAADIVLQPLVNKGVGEVLASDVERPDGMGAMVKIPRGSKIIKKDLIGIEDAGDGLSAYGTLRVTYQRPSGGTGTYLAPIGGSRTAGKDDDPLRIKYDDVYRYATAQGIVREAVKRDPNLQKKVASAIAAYGPKPKDAPQFSAAQQAYIDANGGDPVKGLEAMKNADKTPETPGSRFDETVRNTGDTGLTADEMIGLDANRAEYERRQQGITPGQAKIAAPVTEEEYNALPSGTPFIDPDDGKQYRKP